MTDNARLKNTIRDRMTQTGQGYAETRRAVLTDGFPPDTDPTRDGGYPVVWLAAARNADGAVRFTHHPTEELALAFLRDTVDPDDWAFALNTAWDEYEASDCEHSGFLALSAGRRQVPPPPTAGFLGPLLPGRRQVRDLPPVPRGTALADTPPLDVFALVDPDAPDPREAALPDGTLPAPDDDDDQTLLAVVRQPPAPTAGGGAARETESKGDGTPPADPALANPEQTRRTLYAAYDLRMTLDTLGQIPVPHARKLTATVPLERVARFVDDLPLAVGWLRQVAAECEAPKDFPNPGDNPPHPDGYGQRQRIQECYEVSVATTQSAHAAREREPGHAGRVTELTVGMVARALAAAETGEDPGSLDAPEALARRSAASARVHVFATVAADRLDAFHSELRTRFPGPPSGDGRNK